jgi:hypothetical protein
MLVMQNKSFKEFYFYFHNKLLKNQGGVATSPHLTRCLRKRSLSLQYANVQLLFHQVYLKKYKLEDRIVAFEMSLNLVVTNAKKKF